ncbi:MAG: HAD domain-containing protein [Eubacterium sp.]|nr:HAD domain-containing protein [Eubacterium sp.]MCM1223315.1 HAD domain-containing protein [Lachnospiraceae bacterium]MCM1305400.1 HAD domain-containing protein [Butyrivibrio sp.]MCM1345110.1 HAD domain-containing protein [Muribaculaceae bacterium]MCM1241055.1 HAD domain-containing protein [Lachnospiraceae bacterium]
MGRIIFLDIDGVLNSNFWNESHQKEISDGKLIDVEKVRILAALVERTGAEVILHSGWRFWFDEEMEPLCPEAAALADLFAGEGLEIAGVTPDLTTEEIRRTKKFSFVKADEILLWLEGHPDVTGWVVLDDLDLHNDRVEAHQVRTDQTVGLTWEDAAEAERILME